MDLFDLGDYLVIFRARSTRSGFPRSNVSGGP
jgi:hypothetical protein